MTTITPVILCGGSGTRLWPLSRKGFPKQFLTIFGENSLFQLSAQRALNLKNQNIDSNPLIVVSNEEHRFLVSEQLRELDVSSSLSILEPEGRNTAPALTLAALAALENNTDPVLVVTPADQTITDNSRFESAMLEAVQEAANDKIVILGIQPDYPHTGYGYIKCKPSNESNSSKNVEAFVEKPDKITAESYLKEGTYYWNAGIFIVKASRWLEAIKYFRPDISSRSESAWNRKKIDSSFIRPEKNEFIKIPSDSIDYSVIEKCPGSKFELKMVCLDAGWSDLGSWDAVWESSPKDDKNNSFSGDVIASGSKNTLAYSTSRLVSLVGVDNLCVIETPDAVMISDMSKCQDIKNIVRSLEEQQREELGFHRKVHRPWGWYDSIDAEDRFKVKRIQVKPKSSLSLQMHHHRAEHWIVVKGTAEIICDDKKTLLSENQSTYIPLGSKHRLINPGTIPLEIIEVQSGSYLGEDDIVRFDDNYGRSSGS